MSWEDTIKGRISLDRNTLIMMLMVIDKDLEMNEKEEARSKIIRLITLIENAGRGDLT
tara:strand:- start:2366 stop:2539 length:174 start_codon:yes stop_codon:yes gene_type:complete